MTAALGISLYTPVPGAQLYVDAVEPYFFWRSGAPQGVFYELVQAVASRAGQTASIQPVPVARELVLINRSQDAVGVVARSRSASAPTPGCASSCVKRSYSLPARRLP